VQLDEQVDSIKWTLISKGIFTVQSMYKRIVIKPIIYASK